MWPFEYFQNEKMSYGCVFTCSQTKIEMGHVFFFFVFPQIISLFFQFVFSTPIEYLSRRTRIQSIAEFPCELRTCEIVHYWNKWRKNKGIVILKDEIARIKILTVKMKKTRRSKCNIPQRHMSSSPSNPSTMIWPSVLVNNIALTGFAMAIGSCKQKYRD